ncbi:MAG: hypothetical protein ACRECV_00810 [Xanthobacteraceae bacterium]
MTKDRIPMKLAAPRTTVLQRQISHAALWLVICIGGGSIAILVLYLVAGNHYLNDWLVSFCSARLR